MVGMKHGLALLCVCAMASAGPCELDYAAVGQSPRWRRFLELSLGLEVPTRDDIHRSWRETTAVSVGKALVRQVAGAFARGAGPLLLPGIVGAYRNPAERLIRRAQLAPDGLPPDAISVLRRHGRLDDYLRQEEFRREFPGVSKFLWRLRLHGGRVVRVPLLGLAALALNHALQGMWDDDSNPDVDGYLAEDLPDDVVQIIVNPVPFPHLALRVGDRVYSYGVTHVANVPAGVYFRTGENRALRERLLADYARTDLTENERALLTTLLPPEAAAELQAPRLLSERATESLGNLPQTFQVITLKVGKEERDRVRRHLELQTGKVYDNRTFVNDCASMIARALQMENPIVDPSPSAVVLAMQARRQAGDPRVERVFTVYDKDTPRGRVTLLRDAYVNYRESALHFQLLPFNLPNRLSLDATATAESLQHWEPAERAVIESWREDVRKMEEMDATARLLRHSADRLAGLTPEQASERRPVLERLVERHVGERATRARATLDDPNAPLQEIFFATYRLEFYETLRRELYAKAGIEPKGNKP